MHSCCDCPYSHRALVLQDAQLWCQGYCCFVLLCAALRCALQACQQAWECADFCGRPCVIRQLQAQGPKHPILNRKAAKQPCQQVRHIICTLSVATATAAQARHMYSIPSATTRSNGCAMAAAECAGSSAAGRLAVCISLQGQCTQFCCSHSVWGGGAWAGHALSACCTIISCRLSLHVCVYL